MSVGATFLLTLRPPMFTILPIVSLLRGTSVYFFALETASLDSNTFWFRDTVVMFETFDWAKTDLDWKLFRPAYVLLLMSVLCML